MSQAGWQKLWGSLVGPLWIPGTEHLHPIPAAGFIYYSTFLVGFVLYHITKTVIPHPVKGYVLDFLKTLMFCTYTFGNGLMRKYYGEPGYLFAMIPLSTLTVLVLPDGFGNPIDVWLKCVHRKMPVWKALVRNLVQTVAGFAAYHTGMFILSVEFHPMYVERLVEYNNQFCLSDLTVPIYVGFMIEFAAVVYDTWVASQALSRNVVVDTVIKVTNGCCLVSAGIHLTGMYINPAMATGLTWGCGDTPRSAHILIYWVGPMIGSWLAVRINDKINLNHWLPASKKVMNASINTKESGNMLRNGHITALNGEADTRKKRRYFVK